MKINEIQESELVAAIRSAIAKSQRAFTQMSEKGKNTTLVSKRLAALNLGLMILTENSEFVSEKYRKEDFMEARKILADLLPSIDRIFDRLKPGSPQHTLLKRRRLAIQTIIEKIDKISSFQ
jgi:hypothetical protein